MKTYVCSVCGYVYDEEKGIPEAGIAPGTRWEDLPPDWTCPWCGASKSAFNEKNAKTETTATITSDQAPELEKELSPMEMSIICSNLARGCEKQYLATEAEDFSRLAEYFKSKAQPETGASYDKLLSLVEKDLNTAYPYANATAQKDADRGAQRALVWSEKVSNIHRSLLQRYAQEGDKMLENTGVYICTICGFIFVGAAPPELCPVCKVPSWKFEKVEGRAI
jgi:rubredoxin